MSALDTTELHAQLASAICSSLIASAGVCLARITEDLHRKRSEHDRLFALFRSTSERAISERRYPLLPAHPGGYADA